MEIDISATDSGLVIRYQGRLLTEYVPGGFVKDEEYEQDVVRGRVAARLLTILRTLMLRAATIDQIDDHVNKTAIARQAAFFRGMVGGFDLATVDHPFKGVPPIVPEHTASYGGGYECGKSIRRCVDKLSEGGLRVANLVEQE